MTPASEEQRYRAAMAATAAVVCVLIFSVVFAGMAHIVVSYTPKQTQQNIQINEQENAASTASFSSIPSARLARSTACCVACPYTPSGHS